MHNQTYLFIESLDQQCACPISKAQMLEPVITADGHTYEKQAIAHWLKSENKSPITNLPLENTKLIPNIAFKNLTQKLYAELPAYFNKEEALLTEIAQLKEQIQFLRDELQHEKQKNQEHTQKQEKQFKTKKIEKQRHDLKNDQLKTIREQKNTFQRQLQELRAKEQLQNRQISSLKSELANFTDLFEKASAGERKYTEMYKKVYKNRQMVLLKLEFSFSSNLTFIGHLLQSIEDVKKLQSQKGLEKGSTQTIESMNELGSQSELDVSSQSMIERLQEMIRIKVNGEGVDFDDERPEGEGNNTFEGRRGFPFRQRHFTGSFGNPLLRMRLRINNQNQLANQPAGNNPQINQPAPENNHVGEPIVMEGQEERLDTSGISLEKIEKNRKTHRDTELYRQLLSIKWMMSKRDYREVPQFYNYRVCKSNNDPEIYWYGVKLCIHESKIPFNEFFPYSWNHVRWLDFSSCNVDDAMWRQFIENAHNFRCLMFINAYRNKIENIKKSDLEKFPCLVKFVVLRNKLSKDSIDVLNEYMRENIKVKIEFSNEGEMMDEERDDVSIFGFDD